MTPTWFRGVIGGFPGWVLQESTQQNEMVQVQMLTTLMSPYAARAGASRGRVCPSLGAVPAPKTPHKRGCCRRAAWWATRRASSAGSRQPRVDSEGFVASECDTAP